MARSDKPRRRAHQDTFWSDAVAMDGSVTRVVLRDALVFLVGALVVCLVNRLIPPDLGVGITPFEAAGVALGLLLVLRSNAGYDRWWESRRLWGGIINQCRAFAVTALVNGPDDPNWRGRVVRWTASFGHVVRHALRDERAMPEVARLVGQVEADRIAAARHMPTVVLVELAGLIREARERHRIDILALQPAELARTQLFDHVGGCERILKTPLPRVYTIQIRRLIVLFLLTLPFGLLAKVGWLTPVVTLLVAYPILAIDQIGIELQNPFDPDHLGHLPLEAICATIEGDVLALMLGDDGRAFLPADEVANLSADPRPSAD